MCMELTGYNQILLLGIMMLLKVRTCGEVWMPSFLPCMPISVISVLEDWWSLSWYSWRINSAFHLKYSSFFILYCLYGFDFLGEYRWGQGKPRKQSYCKCLRRRSLENNMSPMLFVTQVSTWWCWFRSHRYSFHTSCDCNPANLTQPKCREFIVLFFKVWRLQRKYLSTVITDLWWLNQLQTGKKNQLTPRDLGDKVLPSGYN